MVLTLIMAPFAKGSEHAVTTPWIDGITNKQPGCALSYNNDGTIRHLYQGLSNLEHATSINETTVFEAGSVAKQFTAAAVNLLVLEGKIQLNDPISKYFPELPSYSHKITIEMLIHHNSGLRDWGVVAAIAGLGRFERIFNNHDVINILARQKSLNHEPGRFFAYTNSGYSLLAILIERVSGETLDIFSSENIFKPLGMTRTEWRSNFNRVVPARATAYRKVEGAWEAHMPFENVVGNGGLLTTTTDLLRFSNELHRGDHFKPKFKELMLNVGELTSSQPMTYASGLVISELHGHKEISHGGATTGYRAFLVDYPEEPLSIALLCNRADAPSGAIAREVAMRLLLDANDMQAKTTEPKQVPPETTEPNPGIAHLVGGYQIASTGQVVDVGASGSSLLMYKQLFNPTQPNHYISANGMELSIDQGNKAASFVNTDGHEFQMRHFEPWNKNDLSEYVGTYESSEALALYHVKLVNGQLFLVISDNPQQLLLPTHKDQFLIEPTKTRLTFLRDSDDKLSGARLSTARVWDMRFLRR